MVVILAVVALIGIIVAVRSCARRVEPDLTISYIGENYFNSDAFYENVSTLKDAVGDINGDGKKEIELAVISFTTNLTASQEQSNNIKLQMSMGQGQSRLYLMDKQYCQHYIDENDEIPVLADLTDYAPEGVKTLADSEGRVRGIDVSGSRVLAKLGLSDSKDVYIAMRTITEMDYVNFKNPTPEEMNKAAEDVLMYILEKQ